MSTRRARSPTGRCCSRCRWRPRPGWCRSCRRACCRSCPATWRTPRASPPPRCSTRRRGGAAGCSPARCCSSPASPSCSSARACCSGGLGGFLLENQDVLQRCSAALTIVLGLAFIGFVPWMQRDVRLDRRPVGRAGRRAGARRAVRARLDAVRRADARRRDGAGAQRGDCCRAAALLAVAYCIGLGLPFVLTALAIQPRDDHVRLGEAALPGHDAHRRGDAGGHRRAARDRRLERPRGRAADLGQRLRPGGVDVVDQTLTSAPARDQPPEPRPPALKPLELARWAWRQLTSMRTALVLLFLLALAAVPGSLVPQRSIDAARAAQFAAQHPHLAPWYDRFSLFAVYSSPWFAATYLLLFVSLVGCVLPRSRPHLSARARPAAARAAQPAPAAGARARPTGTQTPEEVLAEARAAAARRGGSGSTSWTAPLAPRRATCARPATWCSTWRCCCSCSSVALGHLFGYKANVLVVEGEAFSNTVSAYDTWTPGALADESSLAPFTVDAGRPEGALPAERAAARRPARLPGVGPLHVDPGRAGRSLRPPGQPPAEGRRHEGVPARQRLRAGLHGARPRRAGRVARRRCRSCRGTATTRRSACVKVTGTDAADRLRRALPAHRGDRPRPARTRSTRGSSCRGRCSASTPATSGVDSGTPQSVYSLDKNGMTQVRARTAASWSSGWRPAHVGDAAVGRDDHDGRGAALGLAAVARDPGSGPCAGRRRCWRWPA